MSVRMFKYILWFPISCFFITACSHVEGACKTVRFFYDLNDDQEIVIRLNPEIVEEYVRDIHGMHPKKSGQFFFVKLKKNIIMKNLAGLEAVDKLILMPHENSEYQEPVCEQERLDDHSAYVCGVYISPLSTLSIVLNEQDDWEYIDYIKLSREIAKIARRKLDCPAR